MQVKLNDSTRRTIRSGIDLILSAVATLLVLVPLLGLDNAASIIGTLGAVQLAVTKARNALEDVGLIPALLKAPVAYGARPVPAMPDDVSGLDTGEVPMPVQTYIGRHRIKG